MRYLCLMLAVSGVLSDANLTDIAHVISNYSKVAENDARGLKSITRPSVSLIVSNKTATTSTTVEGESAEDIISEYDDFDDASETTERPQSAMDNPSMLKYVSGIVNLLALMYKFSGRSPQRSRDASRGRNDPFANSINSLAVAEDRYNPTTATKKFKLAQAAYPSLNLSPVYAPPKAPAPSESYSSNGGKTSYDADSNQYMIPNPETSAFDAGDAVYKPKPAMKDYMSQNESPVDIQQSYSYQLPPEQPKREKSQMDSTKPLDIQQSVAYEMRHEETKNMKPTHPNPDYIDDEKPLGPVYYAWKKKPKQPLPPPQSIEEHPEENPSFDDYENSSQSKSPKNKETPPPHYSWADRPKRPKPPPPEEEDTADIPPWAMKSPAESKPPPAPPADLVYPYPPYLGHDHGLLYPGEDDHPDHHHHHDEEHAMKDEDRESKRPYTYYHLGRKLWYVPLLFSLYFIIYIGALLLKSISRHKVQFPEKLWELHEHHDHHHHDRQGRTLNQVTDNILRHLDQAEYKFM